MEALAEFLGGLETKFLRRGFAGRGWETGCRWCAADKRGYVGGKGEGFGVSFVGVESPEIFDYYDVWIGLDVLWPLGKVADVS